MNQTTCWSSQRELDKITRGPLKSIFDPLTPSAIHRGAAAAADKLAADRTQSRPQLYQWIFWKGNW